MAHGPVQYLSANHFLCQNTILFKLVYFSASRFTHLHVQITVSIFGPSSSEATARTVTEKLWSLFQPGRVTSAYPACISLQLSGSFSSHQLLLNTTLTVLFPVLPNRLVGPGPLIKMVLLTELSLVGYLLYTVEFLLSLH